MHHRYTLNVYPPLSSHTLLRINLPGGFRICKWVLLMGRWIQINKFGFITLNTTKLHKSWMHRPRGAFLLAIWFVILVVDVSQSQKCGFTSHGRYNDVRKITAIWNDLFGPEMQSSLPQPGSRTSPYSGTWATELCGRTCSDRLPIPKVRIHKWWLVQWCAKKNCHLKRLVWVEMQSSLPQRWFDLCVGPRRSVGG